MRPLPKQITETSAREPRPWPESASEARGPLEIPSCSKYHTNFPEPARERIDLIQQPQQFPKRENTIQRKPLKPPPIPYSTRPIISTKKPRPKLQISIPSFDASFPFVKYTPEFYSALVGSPYPFNSPTLSTTITTPPPPTIRLTPAPPPTQPFPQIRFRTWSFLTPLLHPPLTYTSLNRLHNDLFLYEHQYLLHLATKRQIRDFKRRKHKILRAGMKNFRFLPRLKGWEVGYKEWLSVMDGEMEEYVRYLESLDGGGIREAERFRNEWEVVVKKMREDLELLC